MEKHNFFNGMLVFFSIVGLRKFRIPGVRIWWRMCKTAFELKVYKFWQLEIWSMYANNFSFFFFQAVLLMKDSSTVAD